MRRELVAWGACAAALVYASQGIAAVSEKDDRLALMASGATLSGTNGGWGASATWLHNFSADTISSLGGEHQSIADADWNFGSVSLTHGFGEASRRTTLYAEAHEGSGKDNVHSYEYSIVAVGAFQNLTRQLSLQLEDKQINVDTEDGNLPKLGLQYLWSPKLSTTVAYAYSVSGSLDTRLTTVRIDGYGKTMNFFGGAANGRASPIVVNYQPGSQIRDDLPGKILHEYFVGIG
ncbi:MAG TPA: hypothetical protein VGO53_12135, partial [Steroidobacteraceae bacterium]|nr:hypothetical protein [Steroidobacteraceae bacterium]